MKTSDFFVGKHLKVVGANNNNAVQMLINTH